MTFEVTCGSCQGRLAVETPGIVVACPHCGNHLTAPDAPTASDDTHITSPGEDEEQTTGDQEQFASSSIFDDDVDTAAEEEDRENRTEALPAAEGTDETVPVGEKPAEPAVEDTPVPTPRVSPGTPPATSRYLLSYAVAVTLACIWLLYQLLTAPLSDLERLPEPIEMGQDGGPGRVMLVTLANEMPAGHTLSLGGSRRYGHIRVTAVKVTREMLEFEPDPGLAQNANPDTIGPVLKLWLKFENDSADQVIAPLDRQLLLSRQESKGVARANNLLFRRADRSKGSAAACVLLQDNLFDGLWNWKDQGTDSLKGKTLEPGESMTTYLPSGASGTKLDGQLIWRVHLRKGFSPKGKGVTTIFEVDFHSDEIDREGAAG